MNCLIFDLDGTLVDSESLCNQAFINLLPELNESVDVLTSRYRGKKLAAIFTDIEKQLGCSLPNDFETIYRAEVTVLFNLHLQATPGAINALSELGNPMCIASSGPMEKIRHSLSLTGLDIFFGNNIFSSYDVLSWKPAPGLFIHAAQAMRHSTTNCIVIEDSAVGIAAARAAGMHSILYDPMGVSDSYHAIKSMAELPSVISALQKLP